MAMDNKYCSTCLSMTATVKGLQPLTSSSRGFRHHTRTEFIQCKGCRLCAILFKLLDNKYDGWRFFSNSSVYLQANKDAQNSSGERPSYPVGEGKLDTLYLYCSEGFLNKITLTVFAPQGRWFSKLFALTIAVSPAKADLFLWALETLVWLTRPKTRLTSCRQCCVKIC